MSPAQNGVHSERLVDGNTIYTLPTTNRLGDGDSSQLEDQIAGLVAEALYEKLKESACKQKQTEYNKVYGSPKEAHDDRRGCELLTG